MILHEKIIEKGRINFFDLRTIFVFEKIEFDT